MITINLNQRGKYGSSKDKALLPSEFAILKDNLKNPMDRVILLLGYVAGLRAGEILQCRKEWLNWIELNNKKVLSVNIPSECRNVKMKYEIWRPKTKRPRNTYIIDSAFAQEIFSYFEHVESIPIKSERNLSEYRVKVKFTSLLPPRNHNLSSHCLRAGSTDYLRTLGFGIRDVAYMLGHKDERTTLSHYNKPTQSGVESAIMEIMNK